MSQATGDCNTCPFLKNMMNKRKGVRVPGGFGKCTRPEGACENPTPAKGIGGVASTWDKKRREPKDAQ